MLRRGNATFLEETISIPDLSRLRKYTFEHNLPEPN